MIDMSFAAALSVIPQPADVQLCDRHTVPADAKVVVEKDGTIASEGYRLRVNPAEGIRIACSDAAGEFYARQTLKQLVGTNGYPCVSIIDRPAYPWRGMLIDDCRHFFG